MLDFGFIFTQKLHHDAFLFLFSLLSLYFCLWFEFRLMVFEVTESRLLICNTYNGITNSTVACFVCCPADVSIALTTTYPLKITIDVSE